MPIPTEKKKEEWRLPTYGCLPMPITHPLSASCLTHLEAPRVWFQEPPWMMITKILKEECFYQKNLEIPHYTSQIIFNNSTANDGFRKSFHSLTLDISIKQSELYYNFINIDEPNILVLNDMFKGRDKSK